MKIKVLFITSGITAGGAEQQLLYFLRFHNRQKFDCSLITVLSDKSEQICGGWNFSEEAKKINIPIVCLDLIKFPTLIGICKLFRNVHFIKPDIIQTFGLAVYLSLRMIPFIRSCLVGSIRGTENHRSNWLFKLDGMTSRRPTWIIHASAYGRT